MCGIGGFFSPNPVPHAGTQLKKMAVAMKHRGPDGNGIYIRGPVGLVHTRLAILDLTEKAHQPMTDGKGGWLVYNGEIYNFRELREELKALGYRFHSSGDTEVLLHAMREWGPSASRVCEAGSPSAGLTVKNWY